MRGAFSIVVVAFVVLSGCAAPLDVVPTATEEGTAQRRPVVVAVIDTGINPYHEAFRAIAGSSGLPHGTALDLSLGLEPDEGLEQDQDAWASVVPGELYRVPGTRLGLLSMPDVDADTIGFDPHDHGTGTASMVAEMAPEALIVSVQVEAKVCLDGTCLLHPSVAAGLAWAAEQPWIDVITMSMNIPGNVPTDERLHVEARAIRDATRLASDNGKLVVNSAGNYATTTAQSHITGPPWVIVVGGVSPTGGHSIWSSTGVDVVANYSQIVATSESRSELTESSGTSYAAPTVAGVLAYLLSFASEEERGTPELRERARDALNLTALAVDPAEWRPETEANVGTDRPPEALTKASTPGILPVHMGWGYVDGSIRERLLEVWSGAATTPDPIVTAHQAEYQAARERLWSE